MRSLTAMGCLAASLLVTLTAASPIKTVTPAPPPGLPLVDSNVLQASILEENLRTKARALQNISDSSPAGNRNYDNRTVDWIINYLDQHKDYFKYEKQPVTYEKVEPRLVDNSTVGHYPRVDHTFNICAQTIGGDPESVLLLGAHHDAARLIDPKVDDPTIYAPGLNDNGAGVIALIEVMEQLTRFDTKNAVRFCWWGLEEEGLIGSWAYVSRLDLHEIAKIRLYLNLENIASPNPLHAIIGGPPDPILSPREGPESFAYIIQTPYVDRVIKHQPLPMGSREAHDFVAGHFESKGLNHTNIPALATDTDAFVMAGIPITGLTGGCKPKNEHDHSSFGPAKWYHGITDNYDNLNFEAFMINAKAVAAAVAHWGVSFDDIPRDPVWSSG